MPTTSLTKCELEVMQVVWDRSGATVQEVVDALDRSLAYTTVLTTLKILHEKRGVLRRTKRGRAHVYVPAVSCDTVRRSMLGELRARLFGGSTKSLVLNLIQQDELTAADIREVKAAISALESRP
ncbi:MAG: BlaI/MecI/CopY family transcriptional regulator [Planctomycetaceae bacterium]|nr:BlaI/MecI/CopY family transcriptional regulator [Planctomycetaceae bacterium]